MNPKLDKVPDDIVAKLKGTMVVDACDTCGDPTDLTVEDKGKVTRRCWKDQGMSEPVAHQQCTGQLCRQGNPRAGGCWFVGPIVAEPKCPICARGG